MTIPYVVSINAEENMNPLTSYLEEKGFAYRKLIKVKFELHFNNEQRILIIHASYDLYVPCACHRFQLVSLQTNLKVVLV